jgi:succinoglycan biosynthesis transport protein ExoP
MSHIFEALRKSEGPLTEDAAAGAEDLFDVLEDRDGLESVPAERVEISADSRLFAWDNPGSLWADRFRIIRMNLQKLQSAGKLRTLLLTSPSPQEGKSTIALNLATALVGKEKHKEKNKVLLLEADLRCPALASRLGLKPWPGLSECLETDADPLLSLRRIEPLGFFLLPAGRPTGDPAELLQSRRLTDILRTLSSLFDFVILDCPPTSPVVDTLAIKSRTDASLLVVRAGKTARESIEQSIQQLGKDHVIGIVLNRLPGLEKQYSSYYRKYYSRSTAVAQKSGPVKPTPIRTVTNDAV